MTHEQLERLINSEFNAQELSMLKMLVLTMLKEYDDVNVNESGNIYTMLPVSYKHLTLPTICSV